MANPRKAAEQAISLLEQALRDSHSRIEELGEELKRKRPTKSQVESKLDVVTHRLGLAEQERERWKTEADQLDTILENERVKIAQLKKKLEIAESGPDKLSKKEINFWRARAEAFDDGTKDYRRKVASLSHELKKRSALVLRLEERVVSLERKLAEAPGVDTNLEDADHLEERQDDSATQPEHGELTRRIDALNDELLKTQQQRTTLATETDALSRQIDSLQLNLAETQHERASLAAELDKTRARTGELEAELGEARKSGAASGDAQTTLQSATAGHEELLAERDARIAKLAANLEKAGAQSSKLKQELINRRDQIVALGQRLEGSQGAAEDLQAELDRINGSLSENNDRITTLNEELTCSHADTERVRAELRDLGNSLQDSKAETERHENHIAELESELAATLDQFSGLEVELKDEKERADALSELANERLDRLNQLQEDMEAANEHIGELEWLLKKMGHLQRLMTRRKGLVSKLIEEIRSKHKSNEALKTGLDSLRTFKNTAEERQTKLVSRIENLTERLATAEASAHSTRASNQEEQVESETRLTELEERLGTQVELIDALEQEIKSAKPLKRALADKDEENSRVMAELITKSDVIKQLEGDVDDLQRKLAKLRGSNSETQRLKAIRAEDHTWIASLEKEIAQLRSKLAGMGANGNDDSEDFQAKLSEKEQTIGRLVAAVKGHEATIADLQDQAGAWQRKYEFLAAADTPHEPGLPRKAAAEK